MSHPEVQRLFFALWPDATVRLLLAQLQASLETRGARAVPAANLHATLVFLGACDAAQRACAEAVAEGVVAQPCDLTLDRYGYWRRPQVLWAGSTQTPSALFELVGSLRHGLSECGFSVETRPFETHVTLFRKVRKAVALPDMSASPVLWPVRSFALIASVTAPEGARYERLREWPLA